MLLGLIATALSGLLAGAALAIAVAVQPVWLVLAPRTALDSYRAFYPRQGALMAPLLLCALGTAIAAYVVDGGAWILVGAGCILAVGLVTGYISPMIDRKLNDKAIGDADALALMRRWGTLTWIRVFLALGGFAALAWAMAN